jgi:CheY-like chemotaxis protein
MNTTGHILVAEDDTADAFFFQRAFKRAGIPITLHFVHDGREAIDYLEGAGKFADRDEHPLPRLLLLDLKMPRLDGFDVLEWIRQRPDLQHLEVIIFSGSDDPGDRKHAEALGAHAYLVKPHSIEEMNNLVGRFKRQWPEADQRAA